MVIDLASRQDLADGFLLSISYLCAYLMQTLAWRCIINEDLYPFQGSWGGGERRNTTSHATTICNDEVET